MGASTGSGTRGPRGLLVRAARTRIPTRVVEEDLFIGVAMLDADRAGIAHREPHLPIPVDDASIASLACLLTGPGESIATRSRTTPARLDRAGGRVGRTGPIEEQDDPQCKPGPEPRMREQSARGERGETCCGGDALKGPPPGWRFVCKEHLPNSGPLDARLDHGLDPAIEGVGLPVRSAGEPIDEMWPNGSRIADEEAQGVGATTPG